MGCGASTTAAREKQAAADTIVHAGGTAAAPKTAEAPGTAEAPADTFDVPDQVLEVLEEARATVAAALEKHQSQISGAQQHADAKLQEAQEELQQFGMGSPVVGSLEDLERVSCVRRENCCYGADCRRRNPRHFQECAHPGDWDWECGACGGTGTIAGIGECDFCKGKGANGTGPPGVQAAREAAEAVGKLRQQCSGLTAAVQKVESLQKEVQGHAERAKALHADGKAKQAQAALDMVNRKSLEAAEAMATVEEGKAAAETLRKKMELFGYEEKARAEAVPLKEKQQPAVDETTVRGVCPVHELPIELEWLQRHLGDEERIECSHCQGTGLADPDTGDALVRCTTKRSLEGQLERALSRKTVNVEVDMEVVWLFETNGGGWGVYDSATIADLEAARDEGAGAVLQIQVRHAAYEVDLADMTQTNKATGTVRRIRRVNMEAMDSGSVLESLHVKRRSCRSFPQCPEGSGHKECFAHPGDWDYVEPAPGEEEVAKGGPAWFVQGAEEGAWSPIDEGISAHLEKLRNLPLTPPLLTLRLPPGGEHRIDVSSMMAVEVKTGAVLMLRRVCEDEEEEDRLLTNQAAPSNEMPEPEAPKCWVCSGSGRMSKWLDAEVVAEAHSKRESGDFGNYDCCVCYGEGQYAISAECGKHFFCSDCIMGSLEGMLGSGQFPPFCPMCRAEVSHHSELVNGRVGDPELSYFQLRGIMDREFLFRFLKQAHQYDEGGPKDDLKYFPCPSKCGRYLLESDPSYAAHKLGEYFQCGPNMAMRLGACSCGHFVCIRCQQGEEFAASHDCPESHAPVVDEETLKYLATMGKKCPACNFVIQKNDGCDLMMCGTTAHGKVADALRNGGCAYIFNWNTLKRMDDGHGYYDINNKWVKGSGPVTDRQVLVDRPNRERW